ncbi:MAG TPA: hypothetical protein VFQ88_14800 [Nevskiaceae bacterium]|nr:hypothetical protein [Nevskiaceae bacterium]
MGHTRNLLFASGFLCAAALGGIAHADTNPGFDRPGLGFAPAVLQAGDVIWEQGLPDWSESDGTSLYTADTLLRLGIGGPFEAQLGTSYNHVHGAGVDAWGRGDTSLGLKFAPAARGALSWGVLGTVEFTDGAQAFRGGRPQYALGGVINWQLDELDSVGTFVENVQSAGEGSQLVAMNAGRALTDTVGAYVEAAWLHDAGAGDGTMGGGGLTWMVTPRVQLDASFRHRLSGEADTWEAGFGVSAYFGSLD